ncbi:MAG: 2,3-bisphosphoglycerate-dependent phosphoglycerate mutase [Rhodanobacter sp.]
MQRYLVLARHGQSEYNANSRFTGWHNPPLTEQGIQEAHDVAKQVRSLGLRFDAVFSSVQDRARRTAEIILADLDATHLPITANAALNERDYGQLAGLNKTEVTERWGDVQVQQWRRGYVDTPPDGESLRDTVARALPFYLRSILPAVMREQNSLVVAHGNSLRALIMALDGLSSEEITGVEISTGEVLVYELKSDTSVVRKVKIGAGMQVPLISV